MATAVTLSDANLWSVERRRTELFHCILAEQPHYLVPRRLLMNDSGDRADSDLRVNPNCWFSWQGEPPREIAQAMPLPPTFRHDLDMVWVYGDLSRMATPFWVGPRFRGSIAHLAPGGRVTGLSKTPRALLSSAGVLRSSSSVAHWRNAWETTQSRCGRQWHERGYCSAEHLLHPFHLGALRRYYRHLLRTGGMTLGDSGSPLRYVTHNEGVAAFFHHQLSNVVSQIVGVPVKPSYVYVSCYQNGAELPIHTDRIQCEYSITMLIDQTPEPDDRSSWPLYLETQKGTVAIHQHIGEALFYRGREIPHYRTRLPNGMTSTSIFFHYVDVDFRHPLD
jgi:hypothetical protein